MSDNYDSQNDSDDIFDEEYFHEHDGKHPVNRGSENGYLVFIFILLGFFAMKSSMGLGLILVIIGFLIAICSQ